MNDAGLELQVLGALHAIAPDVEGQPIDPHRRYREQFDFDSMDLMHYVMELHRLTGVEIPEADYPQLETVAGAVAYLLQHG